MGGRGTFAAGRPVAFQYETVGEIDGVKILEPIDKKRSRRLPEESHSERAYIKLDDKGEFRQYREYNEKHELVLEIGYHEEDRVFHTKGNERVLHVHDYDPNKQGESWHAPARPLTMKEFEKYKTFFVGLTKDELQKQKEKIDERY